MTFKHFFHVTEDIGSEVVHGVCGIFKAMWHGSGRLLRDVDVFDIHKMRQSWGDKVQFAEDLGVAVYDVFSYGHSGPLLDITTHILLAYNDFAITSMLLSEDNRTMVPQIAAFLGTTYTEGNVMFAVAAVVSAAAPLFILVMFFQRQIVSGLTAGAVKG